MEQAPEACKLPSYDLVTMLGTKASGTNTHDNGWEVDGHDIKVHCVDIPAELQAVLECLSCKCKKMCWESLHMQNTPPKMYWGLYMQLR